MRKHIILLLLLVGFTSFAQVKIGNNPTTVGASSLLELESTNRALVMPRVANTAAITTPVNGMIIYDLSSNCLKVYQNGAWSECVSTTTATPTVAASCSGFTGSYCTSTLSGTTFVATMTNNGFSSIDVTGTTADVVLSGISGVNVTAVSPSGVQTITAGGNRVFTYTLAGTPSGTGTLTGTFNKQGFTCSGTVQVVASRAVTAASATPTLCINTPLTDITHTTSGATTGIGTATGLPAGVTAAWASNTITISGTPTATGTFSYVIPVSGCGATVNATGTITVTPSISAGAASSSPIAAINIAMPNVTHTTTGATGIGTATGLPAGVTAAWASNTITISGTPTTLGTFAYTIPLVGSCGSANATGTITVVNCGAFVAAGVYKAFMCHNLGATNTSLDPNVPVQAIHGNYYQWGRSAVVATASTPAGAIGGWYTSNVPDNSWGTASGDNFKNPTNDPCPTGSRVPTKTEWDGVINASLNTVSRTGSWTNDGNFTTAIHYGPSVTVKTLTLPAAGYRNYPDGALVNRGFNSTYWSSTENGAIAWFLYFDSTIATTYSDLRTGGFSVRCVSE